MNKTKGIIGGLAIAGIFAAGCSAAAPAVETKTETITPPPTVETVTAAPTAEPAAVDSFEPAWEPEPKLTQAEMVALAVDRFTNAEVRQVCYAESIFGHDAALAAFAKGYGAPVAGISAEDLFDGLSANC